MERVLRRGTLAASFVAVAVMAPVEYSPDGLRVNEAVCSDGTCCPEPKSDCFINGIPTANAYKKPTEGSCKQLLPNVPG